MSSVAKIIEVIYNSEEGWEDAAQIATITEAKKSVHEIKVQDMTTDVDSSAK
jgi:flavin-binding protein dodecin